MEQTTAEKLRYAEMWRQQQMMNNGCGTPLYAIIIIAIVLLLSSCATKAKIEYHDRDVNHYITNTVHDTLIDKTTDSVYFEVMVKGDTVYQTKYKEKTRWRDRIVERHDTCWRDSIVTEYKETTKEITKIPKIYKISLFFSILCIIFAIAFLIKQLRRWL